MEDQTKQFNEEDVKRFYNDFGLDEEKREKIKRLGELGRNESESVTCISYSDSSKIIEDDNA